VNDSYLPARMEVDYVKYCQPVNCANIAEGGHVTFFDDFATPITPALLKPAARLARLSGAILTPGITMISTGNHRASGR
jgi:hypothetical protein